MKYAKLNPIAAIGTDRFGDGYEYTDFNKKIPVAV